MTERHCQRHCFRKKIWGVSEEVKCCLSVSGLVITLGTGPYCSSTISEYLLSCPCSVQKRLHKCINEQQHSTIQNVINISDFKFIDTDLLFPSQRNNNTE